MFYRFSENLRFAVALSNKTCVVYNLSNTQFSLMSVLHGHDKSVSNVRFSPKSENLVYTASLDGKIRIWDLRRQNCVKELKDESGNKPLSCFDVSFDDKFICAGTELYDGDSFILFWDIRSRKMLGGYWESHTDDLTHVIHILLLLFLIFIFKFACNIKNTCFRLLFIQTKQN